MVLYKSNPEKENRLMTQFEEQIYKKREANLTLKILSTLGGTMAGESVADIPVNSSAKLLTSSSSTILGTKGALTRFCATSSQFKICC